MLLLIFAHKSHNSCKATLHNTWADSAPSSPGLRVTRTMNQLLQTCSIPFIKAKCGTDEVWSPGGLPLTEILLQQD